MLVDSKDKDALREEPEKKRIEDLDAFVGMGPAHAFCGDPADDEYKRANQIQKIELIQEA